MTPYLGEIKLMPINYAPKGWAFCNGALLTIQQNQALFALLGTLYGGNGVQNFALPDLRGRTAVHRSSAMPQGSSFGAESVTLTMQTMPTHNHALMGSTAAANKKGPAGNYFANDSAVAADFMAPFDGSALQLSSDTLTGAGGSQPHPNMQPYTVLNYFIALTGVWPPRS